MIFNSSTERIVHRSNFSHMSVVWSVFSTFQMERVEDVLATHNLAVLWSGTGLAGKGALPRSQTERINCGRSQKRAAEYFPPKLLKYLRCNWRFRRIIEYLQTETSLPRVLPFRRERNHWPGCESEHLKEAEIGILRARMLLGRKFRVPPDFALVITVKAIANKQKLIFTFVPIRRKGRRDLDCFFGFCFFLSSTLFHISRRYYSTLNYQHKKRFVHETAGLNT